MRTLVLLVVLATTVPLASAQTPAPAAQKTTASPTAPDASAPAQAGPAAGEPTQAPATGAGGNQPSSGAQAAANPIEPQGYTYDPQGRRDPFISLVRRGAETGGTAPGTRAPGLAGLTTTELALRGTLKGRQGFVAMVEGVDKKTYLARAGDKLLDGTVRTITADAMVILQRVNDPLSLETEREVRKVLRQTQEAN
jgi:Tfp pilus assembly protein PilP